MNDSPPHSIVLTSSGPSKDDSKAAIENLTIQVNKKSMSYKALMDKNTRETVQWHEDFLELQSRVKKKKNRIKKINKEVEILKIQNEDLSERIHKLTIGSEEAKADERIIEAIKQVKEEVADQYERELINKIKENEKIKKEYEAIENDYNFRMSELERVIHDYNKKIEGITQELDAKDKELRELRKQFPEEVIDELDEMPDRIIINDNESKESEIKESKYNLASIFSQEAYIPYEEINKLMINFSKDIYNNITPEENKANEKFIDDSINSLSLDSKVVLYLLSQALGDSYKVFLSNDTVTSDHDFSMHLLSSGAYSNYCWKFIFDLSDNFFSEFPSNVEIVKFLKREIALYLKCDESNVVIEQSDEEESIIFYLKEANTNILQSILSPDFSENMMKSTRNAMKKIELVPYLFALKLSSEQFDVEGDKDYKDRLVNKSQRGGFDYFYPIGWQGFGIKIKDKYENNKWLQSITQEYPEWATAYHGISSLEKIKEGIKADENKQAYSNAIDTLTGEKCGNGIYLSPHIEVAAKNCQPVSILIYDRKVTCHIVIQCRVNPKEIKIPEKESMFASHAGDQEWSNDYWIVNRVNNIRPYRILINKLS